MKLILHILTSNFPQNTMNQHTLISTAQALVAPGKGLLAADESLGTIGKRFEALNIESTPENRRAYRELLFTAQDVAGVLSGIILFDETLRASDSNGTPFPKLLENQGIIPGIKVDGGAHDMALFPGEKVTDGLDGLRERLIEYRQLGARFAKWRAVISIGNGIPTHACLAANAEALARYAALCQEQDIVPIIEPEVIMDGDHSIERCQEITERTLRATFSQLNMQRVLLEGMLLKPNMILPGLNSAEKPGADKIASLTLQTLRRCVPAAVPGIVFLSGGQSPQDATARLNAMNQPGENLPWQVSFSFARALQNDAMEIWAGKPENIAAAQAAFSKRLKLNSAARRGEYFKDNEWRYDEES